MTQITIKEIQEATSKTGKTFWKLDTSAGKMSLWDAELAKDIIERCIGKVCEVEVEKKNGFTNLKMVNSIVSNATQADSRTAGEAIGESAKQKRKSEMMMVAKDIIVLAYKEDKIEGEIPEVKIAELINKVKIVWYDLMKTLGEPIPVDNSNVRGQ